VDGKPLDLADGRHLSLGQLAHVLRPKGALQRALRQGLENGDWFVDQFPKVLGQVAEVRNPGVHRALVAAVLLSGSASAQTVTGTISGTVADQQGQVIPGATVTIVNEATNDNRVVVSDA